MGKRRLERGRQLGKFANWSASARDEDLVVKHVPQLEPYGHALLSATGKSVGQQWLYMPIAA